MDVPVIGSFQARIPQRSLLAIDLMIVLWTVLWIVVGIAVGTFVERLSAVGEGLADAGAAIGRAGDAVDRLADVPLVGEGFSAVAGEIDGVASDTVARGRAVEEDVDRLAVLIGAALALAPTLPVLVIWVPPRVARERERHALRTSLRRRDGAALAYLANRAVATRPFRELRAVSADPVAELAAGRHEALASLELEHLSLRVPGRGRSLAADRSRLGVGR
jgi:hypothetical protein